MIKTLTIIQHNVLHWKTNKDSVILHYSQVNPEIILINSHGLRFQRGMVVGPRFAEVCLI